VETAIKDSKVAEKELRKSLKVIRGIVGLISIVHQSFNTWKLQVKQRLYLLYNNLFILHLQQ